MGVRPLVRARCTTCNQPPSLYLWVILIQDNRANTIICELYYGNKQVLEVVLCGICVIRIPFIMSSELHNQVDRQLQPMQCSLHAASIPLPRFSPRRTTTVVDICSHCVSTFLGLPMHTVCACRPWYKYHSFLNINGHCFGWPAEFH